MSYAAAHTLDILTPAEAMTSDKTQSRESGKVRSFFARRAAVREEESRRAEFNRVAIPHMDSLYNFALRMTGEHEEASDLLQETFLKAYRFFDKFQRGTNCKAWLFRIMKNSYINRYRKAKKAPETVEFESISDFYHTVRPDGEEGNDLQNEVFGQLLADEVMMAVEKLPSDFRTVVILCDLEDFTYEEIAEFVDCPVGTVRSRLHRGRRLLREYLAEYAKAEGYATELAAV
jgi:RNA polymerase sigma-70 factor (ECF subfamily)